MPLEVLQAEIGAGFFLVRIGTSQEDLVTLACLLLAATEVFKELIELARHRRIL